jgi:hypothetical protein
VNKRFLAWAGGLTVLVILIPVGLLWPSNVLGLSIVEMRMGGNPDVEVLRKNATLSTDAFLAAHTAEIREACRSPYKARVDYSLSRRMRAQGYKSSFYYYCWDVYIPYSLERESGPPFAIFFQVSDSKPGNSHDVSRFHVVRAIVVDANMNELRSIK